MNNYPMINAEKYLNEFDQILYDMATKMSIQPTTNDITVYFIKCMIPHHQAAIYMCQNLLRYTSYIPLIQIANNMIDVQTRGIKRMREILKTTYGNYNTAYEMNQYEKDYQKIVNNMIFQMQNSKRVMNINLDFTEEMIPHHKGAIAMCNNLLQYRIDPRLRVVAQNIIQEQRLGVKQLEEIRENLLNE